MEVENKKQALILLKEMCDTCQMAKFFNGNKCKLVGDNYCYQYRHLKEYIESIKEEN